MKKESVLVMNFMLLGWLVGLTSIVLIPGDQSFIDGFFASVTGAFVGIVVGIITKGYRG